MTGILEAITKIILKSYDSLTSILPEKYSIMLPLLLLALTIALYSIFIWVFYRFLAKRDILNLNLNKYNSFDHPATFKTFALVLYILEFLVLVPIVTFFWFSLFSVLFIALAKELELATIVLISAAIVSAVRITAYINEDLSKDLAKMFPFTLLGIVILTPGFLKMETTLARITQLPQFGNHISYYLLFIVVLEIVLRLLYLPFIESSEEDLNNKKD